MKRVITILNQMNDIEYGFKDSNGRNLLNTSQWDHFSQFYYLLKPEELLKTKCGVCWDQVELERKLFQENNIPCDTYFIYIDDQENLPSHTFLTFVLNNKYYWFEHSWYDMHGIHEYQTQTELLIDVKNKFIKSKKDEISRNSGVFLYHYHTPKFHISCDDFYKYISTQEKIEI